MMIRLKDEELLSCIVDDDLIIDGVRWVKLAYEGYYVNEDGQVASTLRGYFHIMKTWPNQHGHRYVSMSDGYGHKHKKTVHRLVAEAFIPNPHNYPIVRHLDDDPTNNQVDNLAWGTYADNVRDMYQNGVGCKKAIYCYELDKIFDGGVDVAEYFGVSKSDITLLCQGKNKVLKGKYHLAYFDDVDRKEVSDCGCY